MAKNKKPGKKYRPKRSLQSPLEYVLSGLTPVGEAAYGALVPVHECMAALAHGKGTAQDWRIVGDTLRVASILDASHYGCEYRPELDAAQQAHALAGAHHATGAPLGYAPDTLAAINAGLALHEAMLVSSTQAQLQTALAELDAWHRQKGGPR